MNLESALRHLRLRHENGLVLWIDALSINQSNLEERTHQVEMMGRIYRSSETVFIYLGDGLEDSRGNKDAPDAVNFHCYPNKLLYNNGQADILEKFNSDTTNPAFTAREVFSFLSALASGLHLDRIGYMPWNESPGYKQAQMKLFEALRRLMNPPWTPWWKRIWTVQEITMPKDVLMICGSVSASWYIFTEAASNFTKHSGGCCARGFATLPRDLRMLLVDFSSQVSGIQDLRTAYTRQETQVVLASNYAVQWQDLTLLRLLQRFRNRRASDPRDKVYALLSLVSKNIDGPHIVPDYTLSDSEVYTQRTFKIMQESKPLAVLSTDTERDGSGSFSVPRCSAKSQCQLPTSAYGGLLPKTRSHLCRGPSHRLDRPF